MEGKKIDYFIFNLLEKYKMWSFIMNMFGFKKKEKKIIRKIRRIKSFYVHAPRIYLRRRLKRS
jgi:hypothetical protein